MIGGTKRLVAVKACIKDISAGSTISDPGGPTGLLLPNGVPAYRFNLIGTIVMGPEITDTCVTIAIDDGTGSLLVRSFDRPELLEDMKVGQVITIIGRPRQHTDGISIAPEVTKQTTTDWLAVRCKEIELQEKNIPASKPKIASQPLNANSPRASLSQPVVEEEIMFEESNTPERIITQLIRKHDTGDGADAADVLSESGIANGMSIIEKMLKNGDIFAVSQGRYKVLD